MEVVKEEHQRLRDGQMLEQRSRGAVRPVALMQDRLGGSRRVGQRREKLSELRANTSVEPFQPPGIETLDVVVQRVDEDPVGEVLLELGAGSAQNDVTARGGTGAQLREQPALPDPRGTNQLDRPRRTALERRQRSVKRVQLSGASDKT